MSELLVETKPGANAATLAPGSIDRTLQAEASSAHSRVNVPLNLQNWKELSDEVQGELTWFHQHMLEAGLNWDQVMAALNYDRSTIFRVLKGTYAGNYENIIRAIRSYRELLNRRATIQHQEFVPNSISQLVWGGLDYALANSSITMIVGESRMGKTMALREWCKENGSGRAVFITIPPIGGPKAVVKAIAQQVGVNRNQPTTDMIQSIYRAFNANRILIADEAHRCLPNDIRTFNPAVLELLRDLHDQTGAALALASTERLSTGLKKGAYQHEQLIGRIGMPILLPRKIKRADTLKIVKQFIKTPSAELMDEMDRIANNPGRLGILVETFKVASRMANQAGCPLTEEVVMKAVALRQHMSGEK